MTKKTKRITNAEHTPTSEKPKSHVPTNREIFDAFKQPGSFKILKESIENSSLGIGLKYALFDKRKMKKAVKAQKTIQ